MKFAVLLLLACSLRGLQAQHEEEGGGEGEEIASITIPPCAISMVELEAVIVELFPEDYEVTINCLSFDENGLLINGTVSGVNAANNTEGKRLTLSCIRNVIASVESSMPPSSLGVIASSMPPSSLERVACLYCSDSAIDSDICTGECSSPCERCYGTQTTSCSRCLACTSPQGPSGCIKNIGSQYCMATCPESGTVAIPDQFNYCACQSDDIRELLEFPPAEDLEGEVEVPEECNFFPDLSRFSCVESCTRGRERNEELNHCFACGLEYCVSCDPDVGKHGACLVCLEDTVLFEGECWACPNATIALTAHNQEEELEEELREQRNRQIELAVTLPILSVLIVVFFVGMSYFAHKRYPHINVRGHKRHRTKQDTFDESIQDAPPSSSTPNDVWRARPTVRLR